MPIISQRKLNNLRNAIAEDTAYFEQYKDHYTILFGKEQVPEEFWAWEKTHEACLKVLFLEDPKFGMKEYSYEQYSLAAFTVADFKRYQKRLDQEINLLLIWGLD